MADAWRIVVREPGGPDVLEREGFDPGRPGSGEVLVEHGAIGLNFIDTYYRQGSYPVDYPFTPGSEAAGRIVAVGDDVAGFTIGDRVGCPFGPPGAYATHRVYPVARLVRLPDSLPDDVAAAVLLKGCTVEMLAERCARIVPGDWVLVHAAAGGVGTMLVPWLRSIGARVIAHAGTAAKADQAKVRGAELALSCTMDELAAAVRAATDGRGVRTVFDGVGKASWQASLGALGKTGLLISFGNASGPAPAFAVLDLMRGGSLFVTRPTLADYLAERTQLEHSSARLFAQIEAGIVVPEIGQRFALADVAEAHRALEARTTTGSTILLP